MLLRILNQGLPRIEIGNVFVKHWGLKPSIAKYIILNTNYTNTLKR